MTEIAMWKGMAMDITADRDKWRRRAHGDMQSVRERMASASESGPLSWFQIKAILDSIERDEETELTS